MTILDPTANPAKLRTGSPWRSRHAAEDDANDRSFKHVRTRVHAVANDVPLFVLGEDGIIQPKSFNPRLQDGDSDSEPHPTLDTGSMGSFVRHAHLPAGYSLREQGEAVEDCYRKAGQFWESLSVRSREHLVVGARLELARVETHDTWRRLIAQFRRVDADLARRVLIGLRPPSDDATVANRFIPK
jgi:catalase